MPQARVERFQAAFWNRLSPSLRRLTWVGVLTASTIASLIARTGTTGARLAAGGLVLMTVAGLTLIYVRRRRQASDLTRAIAQIVRPSDPIGGARSLRAVRLWKQTRADSRSGSPALAERFMLDALASISTEAIETRAHRFARLTEGVVLVCLVTTFTLAYRAGHQIVEGLDVALATAGRAPVPMLWLDVTAATAQPPAYLRIGEHSILFGSRVSEPVGSTISVRGVPVRAGVGLVLTNGQQSVDFAQSADGEVVAHWVLNHSEQLRIAARFGPTVIEQQDVVAIDAEPDELPGVALQNEGQTVRLGRVARVEFNYRAYDDHGLRQIDLVLKSVDREDRRTLMRLDGQLREQTGAHALSSTDSLLKGIRLPTLARIEARDDNTLVANNWGHSGWIRLEPPMPGEPEADRIQVLKQLRDRMVEWLAAERGQVPVADDREQLRAKGKAAALEALTESVSSPSTLWHWPTHVELLLNALREKLTRTVTHAAVVEQATLALDSLFLDLSERDAAVVSIGLAELADDVVLGARQAGGTEFRERGERRVNEALLFLSGGARSLRSLGYLGADMANIVRAAVTRIERARDSHDFTHVQLAAEYLAARLRRPELSAGSSPTGGVESASGDAPGSPRLHPSASNARQRIERLLIELQQLRQEHRSNVELLDRTLKASEADTLQDTPTVDNRERAERLRNLGEALPYMGAEPDSALSSQAVAREQALGAAEAMRRQQNGDALDRVRIARDAIREAFLRAAREGRAGGIDERGLHQLDEELTSQGRSLELALQRTQKETGRRAAQQLREQVGHERQLARRARALAQREQRGDSVIPETLRQDLGRAAEFMDGASEALERNDGTGALNQEQRAQALLDRFDSPQKSRHEEANRDDNQGKGAPLTNQGTVTPTGDPQAAARFRSRVQSGLDTQAPGELGAAIRRYAEGLLR